MNTISDEGEEVQRFIINVQTFKIQSFRSARPFGMQISQPNRTSCRSPMAPMCLGEKKTSFLLRIGYHRHHSSSEFPGLQEREAFRPRKVDSVLQLFERQEDQDRRRLQSHPCGDPSFEHEHCTLALKRGPNNPERRLAEKM